MFVLLRVQDTKDIVPFVLHKWTLKGIFGHMWLHLTYVHIISNLIFLWVFGNAICGKTGNFLYPIIFILGGMIGGCMHLLMDGHPAGMTPENCAIAD
jgi:membrane associated rhomboid family serine protease